MFIVPKSNKNYNEFVSQKVKAEEVTNSSRIFKTIVRNHLKFIKESIYIPKPIIKYHKCF